MVSDCRAPSESRPLGCIGLRLLVLQRTESTGFYGNTGLSRNLSVVRRQAKTGCRPDNEGYRNVTVTCVRASAPWFLREKEIRTVLLVTGEAFKRPTSRIPSSETRCRVVNEWLGALDSLAAVGLRSRSSDWRSCSNERRRN